MTFDKALFERRREYDKNLKKEKCIICGREEILFPENLTVSQKTYLKMLDVKNLSIQKREIIDKRFIKKYDELTFEFINGYAYMINIFVCQDCLDKIGHRHKYLKKHKDKQIATKQI